VRAPCWGGYLARNGQEGHAREILNQLRDLARSRYVPGTALATVHAALREAEPALDAPDRAHRERDSRLVFLKDDPLLADLRSRARFIALMKKLGLDRFGRALSPVSTRRRERGLPALSIGPACRATCRRARVPSTIQVVAPGAGGARCSASHSCHEQGGDTKRMQGPKALQR
jgi:hypothetical protein